MGNHHGDDQHQDHVDSDVNDDYDDQDHDDDYNHDDYECSITSETLLWILCSCGSNDIQAILGICWTRVTLTPDTEQQCFKM